MRASEGPISAGPCLQGCRWIGEPSTRGVRTCLGQLRAVVTPFSIVAAKKGLMGDPPQPLKPERGPCKRVGQGLPKELTVKVSRDGRGWDTAWQAGNMDVPDGEERIEVSFERRPVKQVWIIGRGFPMILTFGHCFSITSVEVRDRGGDNIALTIEAKDRYTSGHSERVTRYASVVAQRMGLGPSMA